MSPETVAIISGVLVLVVVVMVMSMRKPKPETFITPQQPNIPGFKGVVSPPSSTRYKVREAPEPSHTAGRLDFTKPTYTELIFGPGIAPKIGLPRQEGRDCSILCDPDGTCTSPEFYECLNMDTTRYGTTGRGRIAFNDNFQAVPYNQTTSVH